jgi:hypothetical protein
VRTSIRLADGSFEMHYSHMVFETGLIENGSGSASKLTFHDAVRDPYSCSFRRWSWPDNVVGKGLA